MSVDTLNTVVVLGVFHMDCVVGREDSLLWVWSVRG